jgi:hypothetical protein
VRGYDADFHVFLEIGHVLSNIRQLRISTHTSAPGAPVNSTEHDVIWRLDRGGKTSGDDNALQFGLTDDQCFATQAEAACFVQKNESRSAGMLDVNDQGSFRIRVEASQLGHFVKRSRTCGLSANEYRGGSVPMRSRV